MTLSILNVYTPNIGALDCIKKTLMDFKTQINCSPVIVAGLTTPLLPIDRSSRQKINKETLGLIHTLDKWT
jgi:hypothetical protein